MGGRLSEPTRAVLLTVVVTVGAVAAGAGGVATANNQQSGADIVVQSGESIQQAVNQASSGDVIAVEDGVYEETVRVSETDITIKARDPSNPPTVRFAPDQPKQNATFEVIASGLTLSNLRIERVGAPDRTGDNATAAVAVVPVDEDRPDCSFSFGGCEDVTKNVLITDSEVVGEFTLANDTAAGVVVLDGSEYVFDFDIAGDASNITVQNSSIHGFSNGVGIAAEYGGTVSDVTVVGNDIYDNQAVHDGSEQGTGVGVARNTTQGSFSDFLVTDNDITGNDYGVRIAGNATNEMLVDVDASVITVRNNDIVNNSEWGAMNNGTNVLDATDSWWGDADGPSGDGPGQGDAVSTGVDYDPWLENATA